MSSRCLVITMVGTMLLTAPGHAQDTSLAASYGSLSLQGNFQPDPQSITVRAGGSIAAETLSAECKGYINDAPDFELSYSEAMSFALGFYTMGDIDTTLVINDPDDTWFCNDDFSDSSARGAGIEFYPPKNGTYDVWVGTYDEADFGAEVELLVSERGSPWEVSAAPQEDGTPEASQGSQTPELYSSGTGFIVSRQGHVLTNNHVVEGCTMLTFQIRGDVEVAATLLAVNAATDLALLKTSLTTEPAVFRGARNLRLGDEVVVYGFPLLGDLSSQGNLTNGIVSALSGFGDDLSQFQITAPIQPGNSGGPVMNRAGHIVGVVVASANDEFFREQRGTAVQNLNFAIQDALGRAFLDTHNVDYLTAEQPGETLAIADIAEQARHFTGQILCYQ